MTAPRRLSRRPDAPLETTRRDFSTDALEASSEQGILYQHPAALRLASGVINTLEDEMSSKLSRRSPVTTAATLPALAPALASASVPIASSADDQLTALAGEVFKLYNVELDDACDVLAVAEASGDGLAAAEARQGAIWDRIHNTLDAMKVIPAQSIRGLAAKARVADLLLRTNGKVHSLGEESWMVIDDLLALEGVQS
jgi:hypothetical protein